MLYDIYLIENKVIQFPVIVLHSTRLFYSNDFSKVIKV